MLPAMIKADLAGVDPNEVNLEVRGRVLVISGERRAHDIEGRVYQQLEIGHGPFAREIQLGTDVLADEARATYEDGILIVGLPLADPSETARQLRIDAPAEEEQKREGT